MLQIKYEFLGYGAIVLVIIGVFGMPEWDDLRETTSGTTELLIYDTKTMTVR